MLEIERRFEVITIPDLKNCKRFLIQQGYLSAKPQARIRRKQEVTGPEYCFPKGVAETTVCFKFPVKGSTEAREEYESPIPENVFFSLFLDMNLTLVKVRYLIPAKTISGKYQLTWELDIYQQGTCPNGYATVEIEVPDQSVFADIVMPEWIGKEITGEKKKSNLAIAGFDGGFQASEAVPQEVTVKEISDAIDASKPIILEPSEGSYQGTTPLVVA